MKKLLLAVLLLPFLAEAQTKIIKVTTLSDTGAGSLRECVAATGKRICAFEVAGRIQQQTALKITKGDLIVAGETAPQSVVLSGAGSEIAASNVTVSHLEFRAGDTAVTQNPVDRDSLKITGTSSVPTKNVVVDHCSISWGLDENFSTYGTVDGVTVKNSIISEGMRFSNHTDPDPDIKGHSMGALVGVGTKRIFFTGNLFANNQDRNVRWREGTSGAVVNNLIYNWGGISPWNTNNPTNSASGPIIQDFIGNDYRPGPSSGGKTFTFYAQDKVVPLSSKFYLRDNLSPLRVTGTEDDWVISNLDKAKYASTTRLVENGEIAKPSSGVFESVLKEAGTQPWARNSVDLRIVNSVRNNTGKLIDCIENCTTKYPTVSLVKADGGYGARPEVHRTLLVPPVLEDEAALQWLAGFTSGTSPTPEPSVTVIPVATATRTPTPTSTPTKTATPAPTATVVPTETPTPEPTGLILDVFSDFTVQYGGKEKNGHVTVHGEFE